MTDAADSTAYDGQRIALLTQHGKEQVIAPLFAAALGAHVERIHGYDTDQLGTFTRDIPREGTQVDAARRKARIGMELSGMPLGLANEGAFGADPVAGLFPWNVEVVVFIDDTRKLEIVGRSQGPASHRHALIASAGDLEAFAASANFPSHALVIRPESSEDPRIAKGISDWPRLHAEFDRALAASATGKIFVESDLRAHVNPTRMQTIAAATDDLIRRIASQCPACSSSGFWIVDRIPGLPCSDCGAPTSETTAQRYGCPKCSYSEVRKSTAAVEADPSRCQFCNP